MPSIDQSAEIVEGKVGDVSCEAAVANMPKSCDDGNLDLLVDSVIAKPSPMKTLSDLNRPRYYATKVCLFSTDFLKKLPTPGRLRSIVAASQVGTVQDGDVP